MLHACVLVAAGSQHLTSRTGARRGGCGEGEEIVPMHYLLDIQLLLATEQEERRPGPSLTY